MAMNIPVWDSVVESWKKTKGAKGSFWAAFGVMVAIAIGFGVIEGLIPPIAFLVSLVSSIVALLLRAGAIYMGIVRARNEPINYKQVFRVMRWDLAVKVILVYILQILISIPFMLIIMAGAITDVFSSLLGIVITMIGVASLVYISVRIAFGMCYVVDKELGAWESIKLSYNVTRDHVWSLIGVFLLFVCIFFISAIPFGIGLIWTLPCSFVLYGVLYQKLISNK